MAAGLSAITDVTKNVIFSTRRADKAVNADNIAVSVGNADVASGQVKNAMSGVETLLEESKSTYATGFKGAKEAISSLSKQNAFLEGTGKVIGFTADHINPIITAVGGIKVLTADDKKDALAHETLALGTMFACEAAAKNILEMEKKVKDPITGLKTSVKRTAFYKSNPFLKAQSEKIEKTINDYCSTKKLFDKISLKPLPSVAKGLLFVGASIGGYVLGEKIHETIKDNFFKQNSNTEHAKKLHAIKPEYTKESVSKAA